MRLLQGPGARRFNEHWLFRYGLAIFLFAATIALSLLLTNLNLKINLTIPIVFALVCAAWYGGRGPGLLISVLFEATTIIYTPIPADSSIPKAVFGYFSVFSLYVFLTFVISGVRRIQQKLAEQRDLLRAIVESSSDAIISKDLNGVITSWNPGAEKIFGYTAEEAVGRPVTMLMPQERLDEEPGILERIRRGEEIDHYETVRKRKDGQPILISLNVSPVRDAQGQIIGASKIARDITEQKRAETAVREIETMHRLIEAQESERHRIARDLHDHLGQRVTALRLQIGRLTGQCSSADAALGRALGEVQESASFIDRDIGFLSWELRPTELDDLGLADALRSFVREWSGQYGIDAEFQATRFGSDVSSRLSQTVETNLYRIVQEALNNILKHSEADHVNVLLQNREDHLVVIIEDNGRGFERKNGTGNLSKPGGLGLIGMRERAALLNGTLEIDTQPGTGTTIIVRIPLSKKIRQEIQSA